MAVKPGRNDPCPCGSGKKYKHCCEDDRFRGARSGFSRTEIPRALHAAAAYEGLGHVAQAEAIYRQILHLLPSQYDALHRLGSLCLRGGRIDEAVKLLARALRVHAGNPETQNNLGFALHEQGDLEQAARHYRQAIALDKRYANAYYNLHALLLRPQHMAEAVACLQMVMSLQPNDSEARFMLGVLHELNGNGSEAIRQFDVLRQGGPLDIARLDAWGYLKSANKAFPPITGSMIDTFQIAFSAAPAAGLVLEFGVRFGNTIRQIAALAKQQVHGFDSFEGLPEVWHHEPKGSYTTQGELPQVPKNVSLHVGWFENTLPEFLAQHEGPVRLINVDCDIYSSTKTVLDLLTPRIIPGTVIVFDEYIGNEHWRDDEFKAFQESVAKCGWTYEYLCFSLFTKQVAVRIKST